MTRPNAFLISFTVTLGPLLAGCAQSPVSGLFKANPERTETAARQPMVLGSRTAIGTTETTRSPETAAAGSKASARGSEAKAVGEPKAVPAPIQKTAPGRQTSAKSSSGNDTTDVPAKGGQRLPNTIVVGQEDTLLKIASRHRVSVSALMTANKLTSLSVTPGQELVIPKR